MGVLIRLLMRTSLLRPLLKPGMRLLVGVLAIPLFRWFLRRVVRLQELDRELEKDLEQWFRGSLLLLIATANMERLLFDWVPLDLRENHAWVAVAFRLLLAIGVIEAMPDQQLFSIIHPGPQPLAPRRGRPWFGLKGQIKPYLKGMLCQHLARSSPVLAIMAAIFGGNPHSAAEVDHCVVGWVCYGLAITQYLIIGLVTSRDMAVDALSEFDRQVALRREDLAKEVDRATAVESGTPTVAASLAEPGDSVRPLPPEPAAAPAPAGAVGRQKAG